MPILQALLQRSTATKDASDGLYCDLERDQREDDLCNVLLLLGQPRRETSSGVGNVLADRRDLSGARLCRIANVIDARLQLKGGGTTLLLQTLVEFHGQFIINILWHILYTSQEKRSRNPKLTVACSPNAMLLLKSSDAGGR